MTEYKADDNETKDLKDALEKIAVGATEMTERTEQPGSETDPRAYLDRAALGTLERLCADRWLIFKKKSGFIR